MMNSWNRIRRSLAEYFATGSAVALITSGLT